MNEFFEAVIIGGGPAGLTAGIYLMRAGIKTVLLEKGIVGGTPLNTEHVENYPGFPEGITGRELMGLMIAQARHFGLSIREFSAVEGVQKVGEQFMVKTGGGTIEAPGLIVTTGTEAIKLGIPGEQEFQGRGISYCATCDGMFFSDLDVAVIGGGDAAVEEGMTLANMARHVYVIHRRDSLRAQKILQERAFRNDKMEFLWNKTPVRIKGGEQVESIILEDTKTHGVTELAVSGVFFYVGSEADTAFLDGLVRRDEAGFIFAGEDLATGTAGLFVAGDVRKKSLRQVTTAVGDGALAAVNLERYILSKR
jgi:thioredoxin reductase (NADPH)